MFSDLPIDFPKLLRAITLTVLFFVTLLFSASTFAYYGYSGPGLINIPLGSRLVVNEDLEIHSGARIHIQNGHALAFSDITKLEPYCYFYSTRSSKALTQPFRVTKSEFKITQLNRRRDFVSNPGVQITSFGFSGFDHGGGVQYTLATVFSLEAPNQPDVSSLVCAIWADPREQSYLTLEDIQKTLDGLAEIVGPTD